LQDRDDKRNQSLDDVWLCQVRMLIKENFFTTNSACLAWAMTTCKKMASCNFYSHMEAKKISAKLQ